MKQSKKNLFILSAIILILFVLDIIYGKINIEIKHFFLFFTGNLQDPYSIIISEYRLPKALTAIITGAILSVSGMFMQIVFKNPIVDGSILGVYSGATLGIAIVVMGGFFLPDKLTKYFYNDWIFTLAAIIGSILIMNCMMLIYRKKTDLFTLLLFGLMISSFCNAIIQTIIYNTSAEELKKFTFWNLGNLAFTNIYLLALNLFILAIVFCIVLPKSKSIDLLSLGENYAKTMGVNVKKIQKTLIWSACILCAISTATVGPIAFLGMAVPHVNKLIFRQQGFYKNFITNILLGSFFLLLFDIITTQSNIQIPLNAITSLFGAPILMYLLLKTKKQY